MVRVHVESYGCPRNRADGEIMEAFLIRAGHEAVARCEEADYIIVNTCAVKGPTERRMTRRIRELLDSGKNVIVAGCLVHVNPSAVDERVAAILGVRDLESVVDVMERVEAGERPIIVSGWDEKTVDKLTLPRIWKPGVVFIVPIGEGCLGSCTYCATRFARGRLKSYRPELVVKWVDEAVSMGYREIWLSSEDTGCYGLDIGTNLAELIEAVTSVDGDFRVRVGMANPDRVMDILDDLVEAYMNPKVYDFVHLPVQSGDNDVLRVMGRNYTVEDFEEVVRAFRRKIKNLNLNTDVVVGFPGEDDEAFANTVKLLERIKPDKVNVSRYSPRPGTPAARLRQLPGWIIKGRSRLIHRLRLNISYEINRSYVGKEVEVLVHGKGKKGGVEGRTSNYKEIILEKTGNKKDVKVPPGSFLKVTVKRATSTYLLG